MTASAASQEHRHSRTGCLKILRTLSQYLDDELTADVCREIRAHMGDCPRCEVFLESLRQTVTLCRHVETKPLSQAMKSRIRDEILRATARVR